MASEIFWRSDVRLLKRRERRAPFHLPMLACRAVALAKAGAQIFFQTGEGAFKGVVVLPVREIGDVIFTDGFR